MINISWTLIELEDGRFEVITSSVHYIIDEDDNIEIIRGGFRDCY